MGTNFVFFKVRNSFLASFIGILAGLPKEHFDLSDYLQKEQHLSLFYKLY